MKRIIVTLSIILSLAFAGNVNAQQKFGHVNTQEVLATMPEVAQLEAQIQSKSKEYETQLKNLYTQYQNIATDIQTNGANYMEAVLEAKYKEGAELEQKITKIESAAQQELAQFEQAQFEPIKQKAMNAIEKVARVNGFTYIFDSSVGVLLVQPATDDITNLVKTELGI